MQINNNRCIKRKEDLGRLSTDGSKTASPKTSGRASDKVFLAALLACTALGQFAASGATYIVTTTADSGAGSLRDAIVLANNIPGLDQIVFDQSLANNHVIKPLTPLYLITDSVVIDGTTHPDGRVELDGSLTTFGYGIACTASNSLIKGFCIHNFSYGAIQFWSTRAVQNRVENNFIGTDFSGTAALGNGLGGSGVVLVQGASENVIGGTEPGQRNVISGNKGSGVVIDNCSGNRVEGNFIGTDVSGGVALGNSNGAVSLYGQSSHNVIGGLLPGARNLISGISNYGIAISGSSNRVEGNYIGTDWSGVVSLSTAGAGVIIHSGSNNTIGGTAPNAGNLISGFPGPAIGSGVYFSYGSSSNRLEGNLIGTDKTGTLPIPNRWGVLCAGSSKNIIGGLSPGSGNTIAFNTQEGVFLAGMFDSNAILGNSIFSNGMIGIDLFSGNFGVTPNDPQDSDTGPNKLQNFPTILSANIVGSDLQVQYSIDSAPVNANYGQAGLMVEFFKADSANQEGQVLLGRDHYTVADYNNGLPGVKTITLPGAGALVNAVNRVVATATDADGNTSEFSIHSGAVGPLNTPPVAVSTNVVVFTGPNAQFCSAPASVNHSSYDLEGPITLTQTPAGPYPVGTTTVALTVTDTQGASSTSLATVTVVDSTPPRLFCPLNKVVSAAPGQCSAVVGYSASASDNCGVASLVYNPPSGSTFPTGTTPVVVTATDASGNQATCAFTVTVNATEDPGHLYPIALNAQTLSGVAVGSVLPDIYNGAQPGNFGWLTWSGNSSVPTLVTSLTAPGNSITYVNPGNAADHVISIGDWVQGSPGVSNSNNVRNALDVLEQIDITVPVWDQTRGNGNSTEYRVAGFAKVRLISYQLSGQNRITARYLGSACGAFQANARVVTATDELLQSILRTVSP